MNALGYSTTIMFRSILLRGFDVEMGERVGKYMESKGVTFIRNTIPSALKRIDSNNVEVFYKNSEGEVVSEVFNTVLLAIGRTAITEKLGLDKVNVKVAKNQKVITNEYEQSSTENIFAIGDCADTRPELTPPAIMAGRKLARRLFNNSKEIVDYKFIATAVFTSLELGSVGYSEEEAIELYIFKLVMGKKIL